MITTRRLHQWRKKWRRLVFQSHYPWRKLLNITINTALQHKSFQTRWKRNHQALFTAFLLLDKRKKKNPHTLKIGSKENKKPNIMAPLFLSPHKLPLMSRTGNLCTVFCIECKPFSSIFILQASLGRCVRIAKRACGPSATGHIHQMLMLATARINQHSLPLLFA